MTGAPFQKRKGYLAIGGIGVFIAAGYLGMSLNLPVGQLTQPGAAVFPLMIGALLLFASLATVWEGWKTEPAEQVEFPTGADLGRLLSVVGLLLGYFVMLPWLGQLVSSTIFCILLMRGLSGLSWLRVVVYSFVIWGALYAVFVSCSRCRCPAGCCALTAGAVHGAIDGPVTASVVFSATRTCSQRSPARWPGR